MAIQISFAQESWEYFTSKQSVNCIDFEGDYVWIGTTGGIVKLDSRDNSSEEIDYNDGLKLINVQAIAVDSSGTKWFALSNNRYNREGALFAYDGANWTKYTKENSGLQSNIITALAVDSKGKLFIGSDSGLVVYDNNIWKTIIFENIAFLSITTISIDNNDNVWCGATNGAVHYNQVTGEHKIYALGDGVQTVNIDNENTVWCGTVYYGIKVIKNGIIESPSITNCNFNIFAIHSICIDDQNNKWISSYDAFSMSRNGSLLKINSDNSSCQKYDKDNSVLNINDKYVIKKDKQNRIWVGSSMGLVKIEQDTWYNIPLPGIAPPYYIQSIAFDNNGELWVGGGGGVSHLNHDNHWENYYDFNSGLVTNSAHSIAIDQNNSVWVSTSFANKYFTQGYISQFDGTNWTIYDENTAPFLRHSYFIEHMVFDNKNNLWFLKDRTISYYDGTYWGKLQIGDDTFRPNAVDITSDKQGNIWFASIDFGVFQYNNNTLTLFNCENSNLNSDRIYAIITDTYNNIWIKTIEGISCFNGVKWQNYENEASKNHDSLNNTFLGGLAIDSSGTVWENAYGALFKFENETWSRIDSTDLGIPLDEINCIQIDKYNNKWLGTKLYGLIKLGQHPTGIEKEETTAILDYHFLANYPNPFNSSTTISYTLNSPGHVNISIYNMLGQKVVTLVDWYQTGLQNAVKWNGTNNFGEQVSSGIYFARMQTGDYTKTIKMAFVE